MDLEQPTPELPPSIDLGPSPLWPQHLSDLLVSPTKFFSGQLALGRTPNVLFVTWVIGMSSMIDRIDQRFMQTGLGGDSTVFGSWPVVWSVVIVGGVIAGTIFWWLAGWWCRVRLGWCGVESPDERLARLLIIYSSFVFAAPAVLVLAVQTLTFPDYVAVFQSGSLLSLAVLPMAFWSVATTYKGALALFPVSRVRARIWFIVLPILFYALLIVGGAAGLLETAT